MGKIFSYSLTLDRETYHLANPTTQLTAVANPERKPASQDRENIQVLRELFECESLSKSCSFKLVNIKILVS
jgi:hypothetical protein